MMAQCVKINQCNPPYQEPEEEKLDYIKWQRTRVWQKPISISIQTVSNLGIEGNHIKLRKNIYV